MKDTKIESIAKKLGVSISTVSKAIRHRGGVDSDTRQRDVPRYFWRELQKEIQVASNANITPVKINIYTRLRDEETVLEYLDEA